MMETVSSQTDPINICIHTVKRPLQSHIQKQSNSRRESTVHICNDLNEKLELHRTHPKALCDHNQYLATRVHSFCIDNALCHYQRGHCVMVFQLQLHFLANVFGLRVVRLTVASKLLLFHYTSWQCCFSIGFVVLVQLQLVFGFRKYFWFSLVIVSQFYKIFSQLQFQLLKL